MNKKRWVHIILSIVLSMLMVIPTYAQDNSWLRNTNPLETDLQTVISADNISKVLGTARGRLISSSELEISTDKNGLLGIYAGTFCHVPVKQLYLTIYLEVWEEETQEWKQLNHYDYVWNASDHPDRDLYSAGVSLEIDDLQIGETYRLRGLHAAKSFDGISEVMATKTSGLVLD